MASLKDILERYKGVCESFVRKTKKGLKDNGDSVFELPENYIEIALMKIIESRGIDEVDIDWSEILQENPIDKSKWVPTLVYIDNDDTLGVRWDKFLDYNTECGCIEVYENSDTYESFYGQDEYVQTELYREVMDALGMEYVDPKTVYYQTLESFVSKVSRKRGSDLVPDLNYPDGVYILHETLGVRDVEGWNPNDNEGVVGVLVIEDEHKIVVALEDSPKNLLWLKERNRLINEPVKEIEDAESDFNGEEHCVKLNSPDFPAAYYCKTYNKGNRDWYLPSSGELWLICRHLEEIQNALETVGGQKLVTAFGDDVPWYWSSTESSADGAWGLFLSNSDLDIWNFKVSLNGKVRPVSNFRKKNTLRESFTKKISSKKNTDLVPDLNYPDGVYILHETFGVKTVDGWNPKDNDEVVGILVVEDEHQLVVALKDCPKRLRWSKREKLVNQPIKADKDAESDFNGDEYCKNLNSPEFPAAYYCLNYNKGGRDWYLPSSGELWLIGSHLEEIQNALSIVGGQKFDTEWDDEDNAPCYWSSTEFSAKNAWNLNLNVGIFLHEWAFKVSLDRKVRPVSNFRKKNTLKESFTKKIKSTRKSDLVSKPSFELFDGVYIFHETLGVQDIEGWDSKNNDGVVGILVVDGEHRIVFATEESPERLRWTISRGEFNQIIPNRLKAEFDFDGETYCHNLNSPKFPAAYYCLNYDKGGQKWYLPSAGELCLAYEYLDEIQTAMDAVGGQEFMTEWVASRNNRPLPVYWSSTEQSETLAWGLDFTDNQLYWHEKAGHLLNVRPVCKLNMDSLKESFTKKIKSTRKSDLVSDIDYPDGVYILHETLGVRTVDGWNPKNNQGVVGILVVEDEHQFVVALEDSPEDLTWSKNYKMVNRPIEDRKDANFDFNGEEYCRNLNSPDYPAAYYCSNYKKGGRSWYLPSAGELCMICRHLEEIQTALSIVGGQEFNIKWKKSNAPCINEPYYWSSTEGSAIHAWYVHLDDELYFSYRNEKIFFRGKVRPVSNFRKKNTLKESFTKKISKKTNKDLQDDADKLILPKNYIDLALMSVLCSAKKEGIYFRKPKFHYKDEFGDVYELSEVFLQNDGQEIGGYAQRHYLEIEWNVYENGHMEEEPESDIYPFKDEDDEIKTEIYKKVIEHLGLDYVRPQKKWMEFDDNGFDYFDN